MERNRHNTLRIGERLQQATWTALSPGDQPVVFFDGDFRTWGEAVRRARLNEALAASLVGQRRYQPARNPAF